MLGECKTAGGADFSPRSSVEHDDEPAWFAVPLSTPSVVVCSGDAATPLSASGSSGDVSDGFLMPRSSTASTDGGDMAADITRGAVRVQTGCRHSLVDDFPLAAAVSSTGIAYNTADRGKRYRAPPGWPAGTRYTVEASPFIEYAGRRSMPHRRLDRYYLGNHQRQFPAANATVVIDSCPAGRLVQWAVDHAGQTDSSAVREAVLAAVSIPTSLSRRTSARS